MNRAELDRRLRELGIYSEFYYRKEIKALMQLLRPDETLNSIFTGVHDGNRKMVAVTDQRLIVIFAGALASGEVKVIRRSAVTGYAYRKGFLFGSAYVEAAGERMQFQLTQSRVKELTDWAMSRPIPEPLKDQIPEQTIEKYPAL